jgi:DNA-binding transcriptional ArsR family regulator
MVVRIELSDAEVDRLFHALADSTRRDILRRTLLGEASVSVLAAAYEISFAAVQKHVAVLEGAVRADPETIERARGLLDEYAELWRGRIDRLDALLAERD